MQRDGQTGRGVKGTKCSREILCVLSYIIHFDIEYKFLG